MVKIVIEYNVEKCWDCPKCWVEDASKRCHFDDRSHNYICGVLNRTVATDIDTDDRFFMPDVLQWCPYLVK